VTTPAPGGWLRLAQVTDPATRATRQAEVAPQTGAGSTGSGIKSAGHLEEVIVTAQKREENLFKAPIAINVYSGETLQRSVIQDTGELALAEPSLIANQVSAGGSNVFIRGVGNEIVGVGTDSSVAMYLDGVYPAALHHGAAKFRRCRAYRSRQRSPRFSNYDGRQVRLAGGGPIAGETLLARAAVTYEERDHYAYNPFLNQRLKGEDLVAGNLQLKWLPTADLEFLLRYDQIHDDAAAAFAVKVVEPSAPPRAPVPQDPFTINSDLPDTRTELRSKGASLLANWTLGNYLLSSQTAWRDFSTFANFDSDGYELPLNHFLVTEDSESVSEELRLSYRGGGPFEWLAGVFYFEETVLQDIRVARVIPVIGDLEVQAWAVFADASYRLTERLELTAGVRYSYEGKDHLASVLGNISAQSTDVEDWDAVTPRFVASYDVSDDVLLYASASRGFKSGGFNSVGNEPPVDPEFLWSYEAGLKGTMLEERLQMALTAFYYDSWESNSPPPRRRCSRCC